MLLLPCQLHHPMLHGHDGGPQAPKTYPMHFARMPDHFLDSNLRLALAKRLPADLQRAAGYFIPKGTALRCALYAMHHDGDLWKDPEARLER